jgi:hypothetical protein
MPASRGATTTAPGRSGFNALPLPTHHLQQAPTTRPSLRRYGEALELADASSQARRALLSNRSRAYCGGGRHQQALDDARQLLRCAPGWSKGWWRCARALQGLGRWDISGGLAGWWSSRRRSSPSKPPG